MVTQQLLEFPHVTIETPRLRLRMFEAGDAQAYERFYADPEIMRFLSADGEPLTALESWRGMAAALGHWLLRGYGSWAVEERSTGTLVGRVGFIYPDGWPGFELGWLLGREHWGRGFATEAAQAALRYAFEVLERPDVVSLIHADNVRSAAVARRLGETRRHRCEVQGISVWEWGIDRTTWESRERAT